MAGALIKIDEFTVSSAVASVTLGGGSSGSSGLNASIDSTYDVYMVRINNVAPDTDAVQLNIRVTKSGTADTTANYDRVYKQLRTNGAFVNVSATNSTLFDSGSNIGTGTSETVNGVLYAFNFNNSSEYSFATWESSEFNNGEVLHGSQGGFVHTVASASDGLYFYFASGNIASGTFTLYGLNK